MFLQTKPQREMVAANNAGRGGWARFLVLLGQKVLDQ
jgi:hypothetical protein